MAPRKVMFKCLYCGHEYEGIFDSQNMAERTCPKCRSNSVRRLPPAKKTKK